MCEHGLPKWCHWARALNAEWPFYARAVARVLGPVFTASRADVVHVHNLFTWTGARRLKSALPEARWVLDIAENLPEIMKEYDHVKRGLGSLLIQPEAWSRLQQQAVQDADWSDIAPAFGVTISFGLAEIKGGSRFTTVLNEADMRLYRAKRNGRNRVIAV